MGGCCWEGGKPEDRPWDVPLGGGLRPPVPPRELIPRAHPDPSTRKNLYQSFMGDAAAASDPRPWGVGVPRCVPCSRQWRSDVREPC